MFMFHNLLQVPINYFEIFYLKVKMKSLFDIRSLFNPAGG